MLPSPNRLAILEAGGRVLGHFSVFFPLSSSFDLTKNSEGRVRKK